MANLNLKGLWIPIEILTDKNLSDKEKTILSIILFLSKENNNCYCTNGTISELLNISIKKALTGTVYMQIIILHRRYAIKQNESVGFV